MVLMIMISSVTSAQIPCPGNLVTNDDFSAGLTAWTQYGTIPTATVLNAANGCLNQFVTLQATNNSNVGIAQNVNFLRDTCYQLCYCVEFPGGNFNSKLTIAAIMPGVTVNQLLTGTYLPGQAQILDIISSTTGIPPYYRCPLTFQSTGNFTELVIVNETVGLYGSDIRIDNICLNTHPCIGGCGNDKANFLYTISGNTVNFTDISSYSPGSTPAWSWNFGDPPSGPNNTSTLQNPSHTFSGPGTYTVCLTYTSITTIGIICADSICMNVFIPLATGIAENTFQDLVLTKSPYDNYIQLSGHYPEGEMSLYSSTGQKVFTASLSSSEIRLPELSDGFYFALCLNKNDRKIFKIAVFR